MADIKDHAREYLAEHSKYSEVFGQTFIAVDTLTAMVEFAEQETKELRKENAELKEKYVKNICDCDICDTYCNSRLIKAKEIIKQFLNDYPVITKELLNKLEQFIKEE